jgi:serralysin
MDPMRKRTLGASGHLRRGVLAATSVASVLSLTLGAAMARGAAGDLDTSFGSGGKLATSFTAGVDGANDMAIQADGKIVVVGYQDLGGGFAVARYNPDGSLDTNTDSTPGTHFSNDGVAAVLTTSDGDLSEAFGVAIQPGDQKIVVAGSGFNDDPADGSEDFALARFESDGDLDLPFGGGDGTVFTRFIDTPDDGSFDIDRAQAVAVRADTDIVAAGYGDTSGTGWWRTSRSRDTTRTACSTTASAATAA